MNIEYIIVQAGGKGTRLGYLTRNKPKALVPVQNLPMLFHLFKTFPKSKYIIIGDYKCEVLEKYLEAFSPVSYELICVHNRKGTCAGLNEAIKKLPYNKPFMLIWCDLILPNDFKFPSQMNNYIGVAKDFPCRWKYEQGKFQEEKSDIFGVAGLFIFQDKSSLVNVPCEGEFVNWLSQHPFEAKELPLYKTKEYGIIDEYKKLDKPKCRPFNRITIQNGIVIKEGINKQGQQLAKRECAWYKKVMDNGFVEIPKIYSTNPLKMEQIEGENIYYYSDLTYENKKKILERIIVCLKSVHALEHVHSDRKSYKEAYIDKTFVRLQKVQRLIPFADKKSISINKKNCRNVFFYQNALEQLCEKYFPDQFKLIHGDCTFSNILLRKNGSPVLIDPRGYFGTTEFYGDPAYDWAKLYYSIVGNYDQFNLKNFELSVDENDINLSIKSNNWEDMEKEFFELLGKEVTPEQIKLIHAIIWLSLTTYAWEDYDSICGAFYNGLYYLEDVL